MDSILVFFAVVIFDVLISYMVKGDITVYTNYTHQIEVEFRDMPSLFGAIISPQEGVEALLVYANPPHACGPIAPPPTNMSGYTGKWAVLIKRCNCTFETKIRMAQNASYHIAIVHNVDSSELEPMSAANPHGISIPSVFVGASTGDYLKRNYLWDKGYSILIDSNSPDNQHLLVPFAIVVVICFMVMSGFMIGVVIKCIQDRRRAHRHRLPTSSLRKIPTAKFQKGDPYDVCAICIEDFVEGDKLRILPCSHAYHSKCIDPWLTRNRRVCPICKRKVYAAGEKPPAAASSDSESDMDVVDDRTPLVLPSGRNVTQGGTFDNMSENPLSRQGPPLWRRHSFSSTTSSDYATTRSNSSVNSHNTDIENNSTRNVHGVSEEEPSDNFTIPGTSILPSNGNVQSAQEGNQSEGRSWFFWSLFN